jgi:hypothetical protein
MRPLPCAFFATDDGNQGSGNARRAVWKRSGD